MERATEVGFVKGCKVGKEKIMISHLQFADDTIFFIDPEGSSFNNLLTLIGLFCATSGLKINMAKSTLLGLGVDEESIQSLAEMVGCGVELWPISYLGMPLGGNPNSRTFWEPVISKVAKRLEGWKKAFLSKGGRLTLIEAVLSAIPIYYLSLFRMPLKVIKEVEKRMRNFLWKGADGEGGDHLVSWNTVARAKTKGGLSIGRLKEKNKALLFKWLWRFPLEQESTWAKVIKSKFGVHPNRWDAGVARRCTYRSPWKYISSLYEEFRQSVRLKVGNGRRIRFWENVWCDDISLANRFEDLYRISLNTNCSIAEMLVPHVGSTHYGWDLRFYRNLHDRELDSYALLTVFLDTVHLHEHLADTRVWLPDNSGGFSSKSAFVALQQEDGFQDFRFYKFIWKSCIPIRVKFFAWSLSLEKINTNDVLQHKRPFHCLFPNRCVMCKHDAESISHLFIRCGYARSLWAKVFNEFGLVMEVPDNLFDLLHLCSERRWKKPIKSLWVCVVWAVTWAIWKERNSRTFGEDFVSVSILWDKILFWVAIWIKNLSYFSSFSVTDLSMGWSFFL